MVMVDPVLARNLEDVRSRIGRAAESVGRTANSVTLIAVTKSATLEQTQTLVDLGVCDLGENRVQVAAGKIPQIRGTVTWHMIGTLQRNKARKAVELFRVIHSLDTPRLAQDLDRIAAELRPEPVPVFLEVNSGEATKQGISAAEVPALISVVKGLPHLKLLGLMTMAPNSSDPVVVRGAFAALRRLRDEWLPGGALSMGMSNDFEWAIAEGATHVRIGSALFAPAHPNSAATTPNL